MVVVHVSTIPHPLQRDVVFHKGKMRSPRSRSKKYQAGKGKGTENFDGNIVLEYSRRALPEQN